MVIALALLGNSPCSGETRAVSKDAAMGGQSVVGIRGGNGGCRDYLHGSGDGPAGWQDRGTNSQGQNKSGAGLSRCGATHEHHGHGTAGGSGGPEWGGEEYESSWRPSNSGQCRHGRNEEVEVRTCPDREQRNCGIQISAKLGPNRSGSPSAGEARQQKEDGGMA